MSKRLRNILLMALALLAVGILLAVLLLDPAATPGGDDDTTVTTTTTAAPEIVITDKTKNAEGKTVSDPVIHMTVTNAADSFSVITRDDNTMAVEDYTDLAADTTAIDLMCEDMAHLTALSVVDANEADSAYGFDTPTATVTATYHDGSTATIVFGGRSKGTDGYYCRLEGDGTLYLVDTAIVDRFTVDGKSLIGKTLIVPPSVNTDDKEGSPALLELWLTGSCRDQAVEIVTDVNGDYPGMTYVSTYIIKSPYLRSVDSDKFSTIASSMTSLVASGVAAPHPTAEQLSEFGLDEPYSVAAFTLSVVSTASADNGGTITTHYNDREHMVMLGNKDENGNYYALVDGYDVVYLLSPTSVQWAEQSYYDLTGKLLFMKDITSVDNITVTVSGEAMSFDLAHHPDKETRDEQITVTSGDKTYPTADLRTLYSLMIGIHRVAEKEEGATPQGEPLLSLSLSFNDGTEDMSIDFYPMTASRLLCVTDDGEETAVSISDVEEFLRQYKNFLNGEKVLSQY